MKRKRVSLAPGSEQPDPGAPGRELEDKALDGGRVRSLVGAGFPTLSCLQVPASHVTVNKQSGETCGTNHRGICKSRSLRDRLGRAIVDPLPGLDF